MKRVGRPVKYHDVNVKKEIRKEQNRINQRRCRMRKKLNRAIKLLSPKDFNEKYQLDIITYLNKYDFDYYFTGTFNPSQFDRQEIWDANNIDRTNQQYETEYSYIPQRKIGIKSLCNYTERYIQYLSELNLFERCFVVFETGKNNKHHTHILFKSNPQKINFSNTAESSWLLGQEKYAEFVEDKETLLKYMVKELKPTSSKRSDQNKIDNWIIRGDFKLENQPDILKNPCYSFHPPVPE